MVKIEFYAVLKDYFSSSILIEKKGDSIKELFDFLLTKYPESQSVLSSVRVAVNNQFVTMDYKLKENDVVALLPPSSGG